MKNRPYPLYSLPHAENLRDIVRRRAEEAPGAIAFSFMTRKEKILRKSCKEFLDDVNAFGTYLWSKGFKDCHIGIVGRNSYEYLVAFIAISCGGNVAVPIDKNLSAERIAQLLRQSDCSAVFVSRRCTPLLSEIEELPQFHTYELKDYIAEGRQLIEEGNTDYIDYEIDVKKVAAIFFTSGTTGDSKGVMLSHENMASDINMACKNVTLTGSTLAVLPFHHTFGLVTAIFMVYHYGHPIHINYSLKYLQEDLKNIKPQLMCVVPLFVETFYKSIMSTARKTGKDKLLKRMSKVTDVMLNVGIDTRSAVYKTVLNAFGGNLNCLVCGGAALDPRLVQALRTFGINVLNGYGITECSPVVSVNRNQYWRDGSVGLILDGLEVRTTIDDEILVKGPNVMMGYYKDEAATQLVLNDGWYSTGDLGRIDEDGFLYITGRKKNLIILSNGENVSPEEIEIQILRDENVAEAVVYENKGALAIQIFPVEEYLGNNGYFDELVKEYNKTQPQYKHIRKVTLRDEEFEKNSTKKILRFKITDPA